LQLVAHHVAAVTNNTFVFLADSSELKPGDLLPDGTLMTETGSEIHFSDFRGRALAFTFFFTRCPLPDFCPRMNRNFAETRQLLLSDASAPTNWQFLSISFDPNYDQPDVLSRYAGVYRGDDARHWLFATASTNTLANLAPRLDLMVLHQGANISHNMRTVVLDPQGRIASQFDGNTWTPQQLADAIVQAARKTP
jgi:protein SCO1/2